MERTIARLKALGATIVDPADIPIEPAYGPENTALLYEFKHDIRAYLRTYTGRGYPKTLAGLIAFNKAHAKQEMRYFGQEIFLQSQATSGSLTDPTYVKARHDATSIARKAIDSTLRAHHLDAIIAPTNSPAWTTDLINGDHFLLGSSTPAAVAGYAEPHGAGGLLVRTAGGRLVHRGPLGGAEAHRAGLRLGARDARAEAAALPAHAADRRGRSPDQRREQVRAQPLLTSRGVSRPSGRRPRGLSHPWPTGAPACHRAQRAAGRRLAPGLAVPACAPWRSRGPRCR